MSGGVGRRALLCLPLALCAARRGAAAADVVAQAAQPLLQEGAVLLLDARGGGERFAGGFVDRPLPPGSLFKLVTVLAAAREEAGQRALREVLRCPAPAALGVLCPRPGGHGSLGLEQALAQSCNGYFAQLGARAGGAALRGAAAELGFVDGGAGVAAARLGAEGEGVRASARQVGALLRVVIGAGDGVLPRVRAGMAGAVREGTARGLSLAGVALAAKTGTAALGGGIIGWCAGFGPVGDPSLVFVVAQRGRRGAQVAEAARPLLAAYFFGRSR